MLRIFPINTTVVYIRSDQISHSVVSDSLRPHESQHAQASLSITNSQSSLRLTSIESVMPSSHLILCRPLFLLPPIPPSNRVFSNESTLHMRWPKYWSFSFSISPSKGHLAVAAAAKSLQSWSDSLQPHELQHARPPCPSPTPGVHSDSCPSSQ